MHFSKVYFILIIKQMNATFITANQMCKSYRWNFLLSSGPSSCAVSSSWWQWQGCPLHSPWQPAPEPCQWPSVCLSSPHQHCGERDSGTLTAVTKQYIQKYTCNISNPSWPAVYQCRSFGVLHLGLHSTKVVEDWSSVLWNTVVWPGGEVELGHLQLVPSTPFTLHGDDKRCKLKRRQVTTKPK